MLFFYLFGIHRENSTLAGFFVTWVTVLNLHKPTSFSNEMSILLTRFLCRSAVGLFLIELEPVAQLYEL